MTEFPHTPGQWRYENGAVYSDKGCLLEADRENKDVRPTEHDSNVRLAAKAKQMYELLERVLRISDIDSDRLHPTSGLVKEARQLGAEIEKGES